MALLATAFTTEVILLLIGIYLFDGGIIRKFSAVAMFIFAIQLVTSPQSYVSDLTTQPTNVFNFFTPSITNAWVEMLSLLTIITLLWTFVSLARILKWLFETDKQGNRINKMTFTLIMEEFI